MFDKKKRDFPQLEVYKERIIHLYKKYDVTSDDQLDQQEFKEVRNNHKAY